MNLVNTNHPRCCDTSQQAPAEKAPHVICKISDGNRLVRLKVSTYPSSPIDSSRAFFFYLLPNLNHYDSPWAASSSKLSAIMHAKLCSYLTIKTGTSLTHPTYSRGGSHEHILYALLSPTRTGLLYRVKVNAPGFVVTREAHFLNHWACFNPAEVLYPEHTTYSFREGLSRGETQNKLHA